MPRAKRIVKDKYKVFSERLCQLIEEKGITQNQLAETIGKTRQTINGYTLGNTAPDSDTLIELSNYFNVSADYLLGLSNVKTLDVQIKSISDFTGLSDNAVLQLHSYKCEAKKEIEKLSLESFRDCSQYSAVDVAEIKAILKLSAEQMKSQKENFIVLLSKLIVNPDFIKVMTYCNQYIFGKMETKQKHNELEQKLGLNFQLETSEDYNDVNLYYAQKYLNKIIEQIADECIAEEGGK